MDYLAIVIDFDKQNFSKFIVSSYEVHTLNQKSDLVSENGSYLRTCITLF